VRGEAIVTRDGLEGGAVYALLAPRSDAIEPQGEAAISIDLRPDVSAEALAQRLAATRSKQSLANVLRNAAKLSPVAVGLLREAAGPSLSTMSAGELAALVKAVPVRLVATQPIERAISTTGGISFSALLPRRVRHRRDAGLGSGRSIKTG
jgi:hypothetical protein